MLSALLSFSGIKKKWPQLSEEEVRRHNTRNSLWIISGNSVYDVTDILYSHPGGDLALLRRGGGAHDCAKDHDFHSRYARRQWDARKVGEVVQSEDDESALSFSAYSSWSEEMDYYSEEDEPKGVDVSHLEKRRATAKGSGNVHTATVTVASSGASVGAVMQASLDGGQTCACPRCGRYGE